MAKAKVKSPGDGDVYEIEVDGRTLYLPRVTSVIDKVMSQGKSGMGYWGGQLAIQYMCTVLNEQNGRLIEEGYDEVYHVPYLDEEEWYEDWKRSPLNPNTQRDLAGERGKRAHRLLEDLIKGTAVVLDDGRVKGADGFTFTPESYDLGVVKFFVEHILHGPSDISMYTEERVWSVTHGFAGTADIIIEDPEGTGIFDLKTHKPPARFSDMIQQSAYGLAWEEMHPGRYVNTHGVILAQENGEYVTEYGYVHPDSFLALLRVYREVKEWKTH